MLTIGFTNHYYTLWSVVAGEVTSFANGYPIRYLITNYRYIQNLSMDFDAAQAKMDKREKQYAIDLDLRGEHGSRYFTKTMIKDFEPWQFSFGMMIASDIRTCKDVWQLKRAMTEEKNARTRVYARARLIELEELVRYEGKWINKAARDRMIADELKKRMMGHFFEEGQRIELWVKEIECFGFDTEFGRCYVQTLKVLSDEKLVKYVGSSPLHFMVENPEWIKARDNENVTEYELKEIERYLTPEYMNIKATIVHADYKGQKETKLKRMAIIKTKASKKK